MSPNADVDRARRAMEQARAARDLAALTLAYTVDAGIAPPKCGAVADALSTFRTAELARKATSDAWNAAVEAHASAVKAQASSLLEASTRDALDLIAQEG